MKKAESEYSTRRGLTKRHDFKPMKKVLIVAYHYPPNAAVGGTRPSKFARYLPEFGWEPTVLTATTGDVAASITGSETAEIYRVQEWPHPLKCYERFMIERAKRKGQEEEFTAKLSVPYAVAMAPSRIRIASLKRWLLGFLWLPDRELGWLAPAIRRGVHLIRKKRIEYLLTTGPPFTCHLVGLALKRLTGVRWVADFRDPWSLTLKYPLFRTRATDAVERWLIRHVMEQADLVLSVTTPMTEQARKEHPNLDPTKFVTLTNGFDPSDFSDQSAARRPSDPVVFSYLGTFYHGRTPVPFLRALRCLIDDGRLNEHDIFVRFVGNVSRADGQSVTELVKQLGLDHIVGVQPPVPRREALRQTLESHVVLVLDERHPVQIPFKLYDALAAGAVIFNIGSRGAVSEVLARTGRGIAVEHTNPVEIQNGILECIRRSRCGETKMTPEPWRDPVIQEFNFEQLTARLAGFLENVGTAERP